MKSLNASVHAMN